jgi:hypothetical protein
LTRRKVRSIAIAAFALLGVVGLYAYHTAAPGCGSEPALHRVQEVLRDEFHVNGVLINDIHTMSGGFLSNRRECSAQITEIRGNITAAEMPWREIRYSVAPGDKSDSAVVTVELGGDLPLAEPHRSLWDRLRGLL